MTNEQKIQLINLWQKCRYVHSLTCGYKSHHKLLIPIENEYQKIYLKCPDCSYSQSKIPEIVYQLNLEEIENNFNKLNEEINSIKFDNND